MTLGAIAGELLSLNNTGIDFVLGEFVCGEETALIASVEGKQGTPRPRPPTRRRKEIRHL
jgi:NADH:ubiquinone oxidoreductase subunit F (NADH-binding)